MKEPMGPEVENAPTSPSDVADLVAALKNAEGQLEDARKEASFANSRVTSCVNNINHYKKQLRSAMARLGVEEEVRP